MLKANRNLVRNGNSTHISMPPKMLAYLRWRAGDTLTIHVTDIDTIEVRLARVEDLRGPAVPEEIDANLQAAAK